MSKSPALIALAGASLSTSSLPAAIVVFDISPDITGFSTSFEFYGIQAGQLNFTNGSYAAGQTSFYAGALYDAFDVRGGTTRFAVLGGITPLFFNLGNTISSSETFGASDSNFTIAAGEVPVGTYYLGLMSTQDSLTRFGWLEVVSQSYGFGGSDREFTFTRFAFNDVAGQSILAGQTTAVPEASTLGLVGGLFGLVAAAHVRRRKLKQAAASDKFLALAAGEKLN
jgi:hypothetical protein